MIFSKDLKVRESVDYSSEIYPSTLVILSLRRGCLHFCEIKSRIFFASLLLFL